MAARHRVDKLTDNSTRTGLHNRLNNQKKNQNETKTGLSIQKWLTVELPVNVVNWQLNE